MAESVSASCSGLCVRHLVCPQKSWAALRADGETQNPPFSCEATQKALWLVCFKSRIQSVAVAVLPKARSSVCSFPCQQAGMAIRNNRKHKVIPNTWFFPCNTEEKGFLTFTLHRNVFLRLPEFPRTQYRCPPPTPHQPHPAAPRGVPQPQGGRRDAPGLGPADISSRPPALRAQQSPCIHSACLPRQSSRPLLRRSTRRVSIHTTDVKRFRNS